MATDPSQNEQFAADLKDLGEKVATVNKALAEFIERYSYDFDVSAYTRLRELQPPELTVTVRREFAHLR